jgi:hypothetical protein
MLRRGYLSGLRRGSVVMLVRCALSLQIRQFLCDSPLVAVLEVNSYRFGNILQRLVARGAGSAGDRDARHVGGPIVFVLFEYNWYLCQHESRLAIG